MKLKPSEFFSAGDEALQECKKLPDGATACKLAVSHAQHKLMVKTGLLILPEALKKEEVEITLADIEKVKSAAERDAGQFVMFPEMSKLEREFAESNRKGISEGVKNYTKALKRKAYL